MKQLLLLPLLFITVISFGQSNNYSLGVDGNTCNANDGRAGVQ